MQRNLNIVSALSLSSILFGASAFAQQSAVPQPQAPDAPISPTLSTLANLETSNGLVSSDVNPDAIAEEDKTFWDLDNQTFDNCCWKQNVISLTSGYDNQTDKDGYKWEKNILFNLTELGAPLVLGFENWRNITHSDNANDPVYRNYVSRLITSRAFWYWDNNIRSKTSWAVELENKVKAGGFDVTKQRSFDERVYACAKTFAVNMFKKRGFDVNFNDVALWGLTTSNLSAKLFTNGVGNQKEVVFFAVSSQPGYKWRKVSSTASAYYTENDNIPSGYIPSSETKQVDGFLWYCPDYNQYLETVNNVTPAVFEGHKAGYKKTIVNAHKYTKTTYTAIYTLDGTNAPKKGYTLYGPCDVAVTLRLHVQADNLNFASPSTLRGASEYSYLDDNANPRTFIDANNQTTVWIDDNNKKTKEGSQWGVSQLTKKDGACFASKFIGSTYKLFNCGWSGCDLLDVNDKELQTTYFADDVPFFASTDYNLHVTPVVFGASTASMSEYETQVARFFGASKNMENYLGVARDDYGLGNVGWRNRGAGYYDIKTGRGYYGEAIENVTVGGKKSGYFAKGLWAVIDTNSKTPVAFSAGNNWTPWAFERLAFLALVDGAQYNDANAILYSELVGRVRAYEYIATGCNPGGYTNPTDWLEYCKEEARAEYNAYFE